MSAKTYEDYKAMREHTMPQPVPAPKFTAAYMRERADYLEHQIGELSQDDVMELIGYTRFAADQAARMEKLPTREELAHIANVEVATSMMGIMRGASVGDAIADALIAADVMVKEG